MAKDIETIIENFNTDLDEILREKERIMNQIQERILAEKRSEIAKISDDKQT